MDDVLTLKELERPLREPVLITAFAVRRRAGRLAMQALEHVTEAWNAEQVARIDLDDFLDFTVRRPDVRRPDDQTMFIEWPETRIYLASPEGATRDFLLLTGYEPHFYWRRYVKAIADYADGLGVKTLVSLRSFPGSVPHTRPAPILINSSDVDLELQFGVQSRRNRYEGPTDVSGVLAAQGQTLRWQTVDLTVLQPYYFPRMPNAAAIMSLVKVLDHAFGTETALRSLPETAASQAQAIESDIARDSETRTVITELERAYDAGAERMDFLADDSDDSGDTGDLPSSEEALQEIERLLRGGPSPDA
jgi:predicted ATP-grasp superfamily ATP-dependent carboligase